MFRTIILIVSASLLTSCEDYEAEYDRGYSDGYAAGYNTACEIRATLISGDWDSTGYSEGYSRGQSDGIEECNRERRDNYR